MPLSFSVVPYEEVPPEAAPVAAPVATVPPPQEAPPPATPTGGGLSFSEVPYDGPAPQAAPAATPIEAVPVPPGGVPQPTYEAAPPPEPAAAPGGPLSGVVGAVGEIAGSLGEAKDAAVRLDPAGVGTALFGGLAQKAGEWELPRLTERAANQDRVDLEEVKADPSVLLDLIPIAATAPELLPQREEGGLLSGLLPEGAPGVLGQAGDVVGGLLTHDIAPDIANATGIGIGPPSLVGSGADIIGSGYDEFLQTPAGQAALGQGADAAMGAWITSGGGTLTTPPEWNNPAEGHTGGPLEQIGGTIKDIPAFAGDIVESMRSGSIGPFVQGMQIGAMTDPLVVLEALFPASKAALGVGAARAGRVAAEATAVGNIGKAARATQIRNLLSTGQTGVQLASTAEQLATGDPTALMDLGTIKRGLTAPTAEGQRLIQEQAQLTTTGSFLNTVAEQRAAGTAPTTPYQAVPPAVVTPGVAPASPNGSAAPSPVPSQPAAGAPPYSPVAPGQVPPLRSTTRAPVSPTTGARLTPEVRSSTVDAALRQLRERGIDDVNVDVVERITEISPTAIGNEAAMWRHKERLIALSADAIDNAPRYIDHESIHVIDDSGYWRGNEREVLLRAALDNPEVRQTVERLYPDVQAADPYRFESEMLAELYTAHRANPNLFPTEVRSILGRLADFLKALGGAVRETTPAEVLRRIDNGEVGRRSRQQGVARAEAAARVYHGSRTPGLTTLSTTAPEGARRDTWGAGQMGVFTTPRRGLAEAYASDMVGSPPTTRPRVVYQADVSLANPYRIDVEEFRRTVDNPNVSPDAAVALKARLQAEGYDGIYVTSPSVADLPDTATLPPDLRDVSEIVSFDDVPVTAEDAFARRYDNPKTAEVRQAIDASGTPIADRDPGFITRFRRLLSGKSDEEIIASLEEPFMGSTAKPLIEEVPTWDTDSARRLEESKTWARGYFGDSQTTTALRKAPDMAPPSAALVDKALRQPRGRVWWYDISGYGVDQLGFTPAMARQQIQLMAATSPRKTPVQNQRLSVGIQAEAVQGRAGNTLVMNPAAVERVFQGLELGSDKVENFDHTIAAQSQSARRAGVPVDAAPVVDIWQGRAYNVSEEAAADDIVNAIIARHIIADTDELQTAMGEHFTKVGRTRVTLEPRMLQAAVWDLVRENGDIPIDQADQMVIHPFAEGSDFWSAGRENESWLNETERVRRRQGELLSLTDINNPALADALSPSLRSYEEGGRMLLEFNTSNTATGVEMMDLWDNAQQLPPDHPVRSEIANGFTPRKAELAAGAPAKVTGLIQGQRRAFKALADSRLVDRLIGNLMGLPDFRLGNINTRSWGTWEGDLSPQIDLPASGTSGGKTVTIPPNIADRVAMTLAHAWRQDGGAVNSWRWRDVPPELLTSRIINLPGAALEESVRGGVKALPAEVARVAELAEQIGWEAQVTEGMRALQVKLIDTGGGAIDDAALDTLLREAGYTDSVATIDVEHTSSYQEANRDTGYAQAIDDNWYSGGRQRGLLRDRILAGTEGDPGGVGSPYWDAGARLDLVRAAEEIRAIHDTVSDDIAAGIPALRGRLDAALSELGIPSRSAPDLPTRVADLAATGGNPAFTLDPERMVNAPLRARKAQRQAAGLPVPEDAFARRQPGPQNREEALTEQHLTGAAREMMRKNTPIDATTGYMGFMTAPQTTLDMQHVYKDGFHFADGKRVMGKQLGETAAMLYDELLTYIDMVRDPVLQQADPKEFERLTKRLVRPDQPVDFAAMGGPGNLDRKRQLTVNYTNGVLAEAIHKAQPKNAKDPGAIAKIMKPVAEFTRVRAMVGLFNIANIPRYFLQNWMGNLLMTALRNPGAVPPYLERLTTLRKTAGVVKGTHVDMYDDLIAQAGIPVIPTVDQTDKAQLGITTTGKLPPPKTKLEAAARKVMNETATAYAQTADIGRRRAVAQAVLETGYQIQNANLPRIVAQNTDGLNPVLPYRHGDYQTVVREFLATKSTRVDGNTGKLHTRLWGRPAKYTPVYTPMQARDAIRDGLLAIDSNVDRTSLNRAVHGIWQDLELSKQILTEKVRREVINSDASWIPTNISEFASQIVMYPYWTTTAGVNYLRFMTTHPLAAATYGRMLDYQEEQAEVLGTPEWMKSFFRVMNSPMGMTVWLNPLELLTTFFTFPEYAEGGSPDYLDLTPLGRGASDIPFMLNSLLSLAIYATGAGGADYRAPDVLGLGRLTGSGGALLNAANANGLLPSWMGKDAAGNPVPINTRPLEELTARFGHELSSRLQAVTGLTPVPVPNMTGGPSRDITIYIEQDIRRANPNLEQIEVNKRVTDVLEDPGSPEYQHAYQTMTSQALTMGGIDTPLPDGFDAAIEAALRLSSPIGVHAGPEQLMLDSRAPGMTPSGDTPGRIIPNLDSTDEQLKMEADAIYNDAKYGASRTLAARQFDETVTAYWDGRDPDNVGPIAQEMWGIYNVDGKPGQLTEPAIIGGVEWTEEELLAVDKSQRRALAEQYASEHGTSIDELAAFGDQKDAYDDEARKQDPFLGGYLDFRDNANWKAGVEPEVYIQQTMMTNPAYGEWVMEHGLNDAGGIDVQKSLTSDAYLAAQGIPPSVYSPVHSVATMGVGGPVAPIAVAPADAPPTVRPTTDLMLRTGPDQSYESLLTLAPGTSLTVTEQQGEWTQVSVPGTDYAGWVATGFLQNGHSPNGVPGVASPALQGNASTPAAGPGLAAPSIPDQIGGALGGAVGAVGGLVQGVGDAIGGIIGNPPQPAQPKTVTTSSVNVVEDTKYGLSPWADGGITQDLLNQIVPGASQVGWDFREPVGADHYGNYFTPATGGHGTEHPGIDIWGDYGTPVMTPVAGTVVCTASDSGEGGVNGFGCAAFKDTDTGGVGKIEVQLDGKNQSLVFGHMQTSDVAYGQAVTPGTGLGGFGGMSGIPHVHLEARVWSPDGTYQIVDPTLMLSGYYD